MGLFTYICRLPLQLLRCLGINRKNRKEQGVNTPAEEQVNVSDPIKQSSTMVTSIPLVLMPGPNPFTLIPSSPLYPMSSLPLELKTLILRCLLLSTTPLILHRDGSIPSTYRTNLHPALLLVSRHFYQLGRQILYRENTFTASSPSTSYNFDAHLAGLHGQYRQLISSITLQIDWADKFWMKFPLVAMRLGELPLRKLVLEIVGGKERRALEPIDANRSMVVGKEAGKGGSSAQTDVILKAEKKMLKNLVSGLRALREFHLVGYRDEGFARELEESVNGVAR